MTVGLFCLDDISQSFCSFFGTGLKRTAVKAHRTIITYGNKYRIIVPTHKKCIRLFVTNALHV